MKDAAAAAEDNAGDYSGGRTNDADIYCSCSGIKQKHQHISNLDIICGSTSKTIGHRWLIN